MADLSVNLNGFKLKNPIMTASGTFGYADEFKDFLDVSKLGAIVTKAITINPKKGNEGERIFETQKGMINRIGLENVGIKEFIDKKLPVLKEKNINFIMNLAGSSFEDYIETAKIAQNAKIEAIEVFLPCLDVFKKAKQMVNDPASKKGIEMVENEIQNSLNTLGVKKIEAIGKPFDPKYHHALSTMIDNTKPDGEVLDEYQAGYIYNDKVIKYSQVIVNKLKEEKNE